MHRADPPRGNEMQTDRQFAQDIPENGYFGESEKRPAKSRRTTKRLQLPFNVAIDPFRAFTLSEGRLTETFAPKGRAVTAMARR